MPNLAEERENWLNGDEFAYYLKVITPTRGDPTFELLKTHLMLEETLNEFIDVKVRSPQYLEDARFTFAQKLIVARSLASIPDDWIWEALRKLNQLRNKLAHFHEVKDLESRTEELVKFVRDSFPASSSAGALASGRSALTMTLVTLFVILRADLRWERRFESGEFTLPRGTKSLPKLGGAVAERRDTT